MHLGFCSLPGWQVGKRPRNASENSASLVSYCEWRNKKYISARRRESQQRFKGWWVFNNSKGSLDSIFSHCLGKEPAFLPRKHSWAIRNLLLFSHNQISSHRLLLCTNFSIRSTMDVKLRWMQHAIELQEMSKSKSLILTEENARKVCQWLRCVLYSVNRVGKIGTMWCMNVGQKKKFNRESKNPRHWAKDKKLGQNGVNNCLYTWAKCHKYYVREKMNLSYFITVIFSLESTINWLKTKILYSGRCTGCIFNSLLEDIAFFLTMFKFVIFSHLICNLWSNDVAY